MSGEPLGGLGSPGFFGKTPSRGDFVSRRLSSEFVAYWDGWLQSAMAASQAALGSRWLDVYLTSPIWRFALSPGICGEASHLGVVVPSVDKVGRYFPMAVVLACGRERSPVELAAGLEGWYLDAENLLLETLAETPLALEAFDERLSRLTVAGAAESTDVAPAWRLGEGDSVLRWHCSVPESFRVRDAVLPLFAALLDDRVTRYGVWWTRGSERVAPCVLLASELPAPEAFIAMLDGGWAERGWSSGAVGPGPVRRSHAPALHCRSAAVSDTGKTRVINEDSFASRDDLGIWMVADGMGGHQAGDAASHMVTSVVDRLGGSSSWTEGADRAGGNFGSMEGADWAGGNLSPIENADRPGAKCSLAENVERLVGSLRVVNACLQVLAERDARISLAGSTVVALIVDGREWTCLWAGDSRLYRLRDGVLQQVTHDHSDEGDSLLDHSITRAVGGDEELELEMEHGDLRDGDRYLLCTDGLYGEVSVEGIAAALSLADPDESCRQLQHAALSGEARDNLTAVVVQCFGPAAGVP